MHNTTLKSIQRAIDEQAAISSGTPIVGKAPRRPNDPDGLGFTKRGKRVRFARERFARQVRSDHADWSDQQVRNEVNEKLKEWENMAPGIVKQYELLEPTCVAPRRDRVNRKVEVAAMRRTPEVSAIEDHLRSTPSVKESSVRMAIAMLEDVSFQSVVPELKEARDDFFGGDALLDWAYGDPTDGTTVKSAAGIGKSLHAMLDDEQNDPRLLVRFNLQAIKRLWTDSALVDT